MTSTPYTPQRSFQLVGGQQAQLPEKTGNKEVLNNLPTKRPSPKNAKERLAVRILILEKWLVEATQLISTEIQKTYTPTEGSEFCLLSSDSGFIHRALCNTGVIFNTDFQITNGCLPLGNYFYCQRFAVEHYEKESDWQTTGLFKELIVRSDVVLKRLAIGSFVRTCSPGAAELTFKMVSGRPCFELNIDSLEFGIPPIKVSTIPTRFWRYQVNDDTYQCNPEHHSVFPVFTQANDIPKRELETLPPELARIVENAIVSIASAEKLACKLIEEFSPNFY